VVERGFQGVLLGSRVMRWKVPEMVLGAVMPSDSLLVAKPSHVGANVTGPACHLHGPTAYGWQARGQSPLTDTALLYLVAKLLLGVPPPMSIHIPLLSDMGTKSLDRCCPI
jgi:hypothetical protein